MHCSGTGGFPCFVPPHLQPLAVLLAGRRVIASRDPDPEFGIDGEDVLGNDLGHLQNASIERNALSCAHAPCSSRACSWPPERKSRVAGCALEWHAYCMHAMLRHRGAVLWMCAVCKCPMRSHTIAVAAYPLPSEPHAKAHATLIGDLHDHLCSNGRQATL